MAQRSRQSPDRDATIDFSRAVGDFIFMPVKLYFNPRSRATLIRWLLEELTLDYDVESVSYEDGSMRSSEFLELNPMGKIPILVDGDTVVTETVAIAIYLADRYRDAVQMAPALDDPKRGDYLRWMVFQAACIEPAMIQKRTGFETVRASSSWGNVDLVVKTLESRLENTDAFLLGDEISAVDIILGGSIGWALHFDLFPKHPALVNYSQRLTGRPAFARSMSPN